MILNPEKQYIEQIYSMTEKHLVSEIEKHNYLYWIVGDPEISDETYDLLIRRLEELNPEHVILKKALSAKVFSSGKIILNEPMMSLYKTYYFKIAPKGKKSLIDWVQENSRSEDETYLIQPKYDGISAYFFDGTLATKGRQDIEGENISDKIPIIKLITSNYKGQLSKYNGNNVRGEITINDSEFEFLKDNLCKVDGNIYKNSRNAVSGILNLKNISKIIDKDIFLTLIDYDSYSWTLQCCEFENKWNDIIGEIDKLDYPIDGIVVKIADKNYSKSLGNTAHHPRGQLAFKFSGKTKKSKLIGVEWSFGKGRLTPVGKIEPVEINGVIISNITLHNINFVEENDLQIGDILTIERAGDVIPHVIKSESGIYRKSLIITNCPYCGNEVIRDNKIIKCINSNCFETNLQKFLYFIRALGIKKIGDNNLRKIVSTLNLSDFIDIFNINKEDLIRIEGFRNKMSEGIYNSIWKNKKIEDFKILSCLDIDFVGENVARKILRDYTINELINMSENRLSSIIDIGPKISSNLYVGLRKNAYKIRKLSEIFEIIVTRKCDTSKKIFYLNVKNPNDKNINRCIDLLKSNNYAQIKSVKKQDGSMYLPEELDIILSDKYKNFYSQFTKILSVDECIRLFGDNVNLEETKTICFTGKFDKDKDFYRDIANKQGYQNIYHVTKDLDLLVSSSKDFRSSKISIAEKFGVEIVSIDEWLDMLK